MITQATPLALLKQGLYDQLSLSGLLIASPGGALGETSALALIIGGAYLLYKKQIRWQIPASMIATVLVIATFWGNPWRISLRVSRSIMSLPAGCCWAPSSWLPTG